MKTASIGLLILTLLAGAARADDVLRPAACNTIAAATVAPGTGYLPGTYLDTPLTGGHGSGAVADIFVDPSGKVADAQIHPDGPGYQVGDVLTAVIGKNGSGFSLTVVGLGLVEPDQALRVKRHLFNPCWPDKKS